VRSAALWHNCWMRASILGALAFGLISGIVIDSVLNY
jgi:hypothetical protein